MIRTVADFLEELARRETGKLDSFGISHAPTIGAMYEGLSKTVLSQAIPGGLDLQVVSGFITDGMGSQSGQIDCMLVRGKGQAVPFTAEYIWHIKDVLAVFEIKKNLYGPELSDAFDHLREVKRLESSYLQALENDGSKLDTLLAECAFEAVTGFAFPAHDDVVQLDITAQLIYHTLFIEQFSVVRIILGYHGFKTEHGFRRSLVGRLLQKSPEFPAGASGYGVGSFPQLIISGQFSLCKGNGQPFAAKVVDGLWPFYFSANAHPIELLLEFIWTRLEHACHAGAPWGEDLTTPALHPFLSARAVSVEGRLGWSYDIHDIPAGLLKSAPARVEFSPTCLSPEQADVMARLGNGLPVSTGDAVLVHRATEAGVSVPEFIKGLVDTGLVAIGGTELQLTTQQCVVMVLPDGQFVAGENVSGCMMLWLEKYYSERSGRLELEDQGG